MTVETVETGVTVETVETVYTKVTVETVETVETEVTVEIGVTVETVETRVTEEIGVTGDTGQIINIYSKQDCVIILLYDDIMRRKVTQRSTRRVDRSSHKILKEI